MAARVPWRQLSPHNAGCYPDAIRQIMQWIWWEVRIDHNHVTMCFLCNICSHVSGYHLVKRAMMELAPVKGTLDSRAMKRIGKTTTIRTPIAKPILKVLQGFAIRDNCIHTSTLLHC